MTRAPARKATSKALENASAAPPETTGHPIAEEVSVLEERGDAVTREELLAVHRKLEALANHLNLRLPQ